MKNVVERINKNRGFFTTSRQPYLCPKTMKRRPCWCPKPLLWELNYFPMQTPSFVEWKHSSTNHSKTLFDLIVTNRKDLVKQKGTCPLGVSDHDMIYAALSATVPRDPPKIITMRDFNKFSERNFQSDIARAPFQVCEVFDDPAYPHSHGYERVMAEFYPRGQPIFQQLCRNNRLP